MAYQNGTTHYNLPQTIGTDKRDWSDTNEAFANVDSALYTASEGVSGLNTRVTQNESDIKEVQEDTTQNTADITSLAGRMTSAEQNIVTANNNITDLRNDAEDMITAYNESSATSAHSYAVGDYFIYNDTLYRATAAIASGATIVPNTNCTTINITTVLNENAHLKTTIAPNSGETYESYYNRIASTIINLIENAPVERRGSAFMTYYSTNTTAEYVAHLTGVNPSSVTFIANGYYGTEPYTVVTEMSTLTTSSSPVYYRWSITAGSTDTSGTNLLSTSAVTHDFFI